MSWSTLRRLTSATLVFGLFSLSSSGVVQAGSPSTLSGRVLAQNGADPRPGVVVALFEPATERAFRSSPTDARGTFTIDAAPAGDYALVVEAPEGAFLASNHVQLAPGVNRPVSLALKPGKAGEPPADAAPQSAHAKDGVATWAKWVIAGGIIVGGAVIVYEVTKNNEASMFVLGAKTWGSRRSRTVRPITGWRRTRPACSLGRRAVASGLTWGAVGLRHRYSHGAL